MWLNTKHLQNIRPNFILSCLLQTLNQSTKPHVNTWTYLLLCFLLSLLRDLERSYLFFFSLPILRLNTTFQFVNKPDSTSATKDTGGTKIHILAANFFIFYFADSSFGGCEYIIKWNYSFKDHMFLGVEIVKYTTNFHNTVWKMENQLRFIHSGYYIFLLVSLLWKW